MEKAGNSAANEREFVLLTCLGHSWQCIYFEKIKPRGIQARMKNKKEVSKESSYFETGLEVSTGVKLIRPQDGPNLLRR